MSEVELVCRPLTGSLADELAGPDPLPNRDEPGDGAGLREGAAGCLLYWLGQAGFVIRVLGLDEPTLVVDPYLSDSLEHKYRGKFFEHVRMMPAPISPAALGDVDAVLCTHRHSDHMDPGTLPDIAATNRHSKFIVPEPELPRALEIGLPRERVVGLAPGRLLSLGPTTRVEAIPSAHETLEVLSGGASRFVGYVIHAAALCIYHSGDCIPYDGLAEVLAARRIDLALLPANGRDANRSDNGVPGNFTWDEAVELCAQAQIPYLVPHHVGMFAFNTVDVACFDLDWAASQGVTVVLPNVRQRIELTVGMR